MGYTEVYGGPGTSRAAEYRRATPHRSAVTSVGSDIVGSPRELALLAQRQRAGLLSSQLDLHYGEGLRIGRPAQQVYPEQTVQQIPPPRVSVERREPNPADIHLITDPSIQAVGEMIRYASPPDWAVLTERISPFIRSRKIIHGKLAEEYVGQQFEDFAILFGDTYTNPNLHGVATPYFSFVQRPGKNLRARISEPVLTRKGVVMRDRDAAEYDGFALINGKPVVFEIKAQGPEMFLARQSFGEDWYRKILHPLQGYYGNEFGLVVVTLPEVFEHTDLQPGYDEASGVHFYAMNTTWEELYEQARELADTNKLKVA